MIQRRSVRHALLAAATLTAVGACTHAQRVDRPAAPPGVDPAADRALREMSDYLGSASSFTFHTEIVYDHVRSLGEKIELSMSSDVVMRRPGSLHVVTTGDEQNGRVYNDGKTFVFLDTDENTFARTAVPNDLGLALDQIWEEFGIEVPVADFVYPDPYAGMIEHADTGRHVGRHRVGDVMCDHLAFTAETIDWQIWIEDGPSRVPRKLVITYKQRDSEPQYSAVMSNWVMNPLISDHVFRFDPPPGADEIEFLPVYDVPWIEEEEEQ